MPAKLDDETQRVHLIAPTSWMKKVDDWPGISLTCQIFRKRSAGWLKWALRAHRKRNQ